MNVLEYLRNNNISIDCPCGGNGTCKKCLVIIDKQPPVLACRTEYKTGCHIEVVNQSKQMRILDVDETISGDTIDSDSGRFGVAIDIGTTTIAGVIVEISKCRIFGAKSLENSNKKYGADVISRINSGRYKEMQFGMQTDIKNVIYSLLGKHNVKKLDVIALAGNTTMINTLMGCDLLPLGRYPYEPEQIKTVDTSAKEALGLNEEFIKDTRVVIFPGTSAFIGGDIVSGLYFLMNKTHDIISRDMENGKNSISKDIITGDFVSADMKFGKNTISNDIKCHNGTISNDIDAHKMKAGGFIAVMDLGTNGEMGLYNDNTVLTCSASAGPVFEGGNITCGIASVPGAIDHMKIEEDGKCSYSTIENDDRVMGLCGSGVIDCAAELIKHGFCDVHGTFISGECYRITKRPDRSDIVFTQEDMRQVQLAKAAIISGLWTLCVKAGITYADIDKLYLAGGMGYAIDIDSAVRVGLIPKELEGSTVAVGNTSLKGCTELICSDVDLGIKQAEEISERIKVVDLASEPGFERLYLDNIDFDPSFF